MREIDRAGVKESCVRVFFIRVMSRQRSQKNPATGLERAVARPRDTTLKRSHSATTQCTTNNSTLTRYPGFSSSYILLQASRLCQIAAILQWRLCALPARCAQRTRRHAAELLQRGHADCSPDPPLGRLERRGTSTGAILATTAGANPPRGASPPR